MRTLVVDENGALSIREVSMPQYNDDQALVKTVSCGVCNGTDAKLIHRNFKGFEAPKDYPLMLGHEAVGRVVEVGKNVTSFKVGDCVLLPFTNALDGINSAWGAYSEYGIVDDPEALVAKGMDKNDPSFPEFTLAQQVVPTDIDPVDAAMIVTLREVLSAIRYFGMKPTDNVVVFGCGPVGLTFTKFMSLLGIKNIVALDIVEEKLQDAKKCGAAYVLNSKSSNVNEEIRKIFPDGANYVLDAVGVSAIINQAMELICDRGKICCYGISPNCNMNLDWTKAPYNWDLRFQQFPSKREEAEAYDQVLAWLRDGDISLKDYISDIMDFEDIIEAFAKVERREIAKKCIIRYK